MTDTITLPRSVVEQALKALEKSDRISGYRNNRAAVNSLIAALEQPQVEQEPIRWPANASEVRAFLSGHVAAERYARDDHQPDDSDTYTLSAHDLLGAIYWWTDFDPQPPRQPLTDEAIDAIIKSNFVAITNQNLYDAIYLCMRDVESAHDIEEQK